MTTQESNAREREGEQRRKTTRAINLNGNFRFHQMIHCCQAKKRLHFRIRSNKIGQLTTVPLLVCLNSSSREDCTSAFNCTLAWPPLCSELIGRLAKIPRFPNNGSRLGGNARGFPRLSNPNRADKIKFISK
jgi:hypothetical protein